MYLYREYPQGLKEQAEPPESAAQQRLPAGLFVAMMSVGGKVSKWVSYTSGYELAISSVCVNIPVNATIEILESTNHLS